MSALREREIAVTRDELRQELPRLAAFAKIIVLDRAIAHAKVMQWLTATLTEPSLRPISRVDAYRSLAMLPAGDAPARPAEGDCLADPVLREVGARERTWCFLTGPAGFSDDVADAIVSRMPVQVESAPAGAGASAEQELSLGPWPDMRILRLAG